MLNFANQNYTSMYAPQTSYSCYPTTNNYSAQYSCYPTTNNYYSNNYYQASQPCTTNVINNYYVPMQQQQPSTNIINNYYPAQQQAMQYPQQQMMPVMQQSTPYAQQMMYSAPVQQQSFDISSLFSSLLGNVFSSIMNNQTQQITPTFTYTDNSTQNNLLNLFKSLLGISNNTTQTSTQAPTNQNNAWQLLFDVVSEFLTDDDDTVEELDDDTDSSSSAAGDPHFALNGQQAFDFQGKNEGVYTMLDNKDVSLKAQFTGSTDDGGARVIDDQNLEIKKQGINIVWNNGTFEILKDGEKIADQTNFNSDEEAMKILKDSGVEVTQEGGNLKVKYNNREITLGSRQVVGYTMMKGDTGLLSQAAGANDADHDGKSGNYDYEVDNQVFVHTEISGSSCATLTDEVKAAIEADAKAGEAKGSMVLGYTEGHGYDARQWNEYLGMKLFTSKDELLEK